MKAIVQEVYGPPDLLKLMDVEKPAPKDNQVLVKVAASSINYNNLGFVLGEPWLIRVTGLTGPKYRTPGNDIAGVVEAVGKDVKQFKPGDEVYGDLFEAGFGAFAEYVCVPEKTIAVKPGNLSFEDAAAVPESSIVALQGLRNAKIAAGKKVLINGASGGIGTFAVQIAKALGAEVTGVCSTKNLELVRSIGAAHVIDYTREDFAESGKKYDLILATTGYRPILDYKKALSPDGVYAATGGTMFGKEGMKQIWEGMLIAPFLSLSGRQKMFMSNTVPNRKDLDYMRGLIESGKIKPVIDRKYPLSRVAEALTYYKEGHTKGKIVITFNN
jgi:NADPH:quinone reductase-like Zn-dependent oxidoreductase